MASRYSPSGPSPLELVTVSEFRAKLAEMLGRVERGEEVLIARGREPVAKLVPLRKKRKRRLGVLKYSMSEETLTALSEILNEPLSSHDQAAQEGNHTNILGIRER